MRRFGVVHGVVLLLLGFACRGALAATPTLSQSLAALEQQYQGRLGLAYIDSGSGEIFSYRGEERFAFCSTFKALLAGAVLQRSVSQPGLLDKQVSYGATDLLSYAPITKAHLGKGMSVGELAAAAVQYSDNTAANLLLEEIGGVQALNRFTRELGDKAFRLDRIEPHLNSAIPGDERDTTTPLAMARTLQAMTLGKGLPAAQQAQLVSWLKGNTTGAQSIRAGVPPHWSVGDKTGGGEYGTTNDIAVLWPEQGAPKVLAIYFTQPDAKAQAQRAILAEATRLVLAGEPHSQGK